MKIDRVTIVYGELRSSSVGYSNRRYEFGLSATLEPGESAEWVRKRLTELAQREVARYFGDNVNPSELDLPF